MSLRTASSKSEVETVSTKVTKAKKEVEILKAELENLIKSGISCNPPLRAPEEPQSAIADAPIIKQPDRVTPPPLNLKKNVRVTQKKFESVKVNSPKKRSYNVAEAREYIKQQREKRAEELKSKIHTTDNKLDLKKQKLKELHQKALELVNKSVQLKRERSKSRDKSEPLRLDKANPRQKSSDRINQKSAEEVNTFRSKSRGRVENKENKPRPDASPEVPRCRARSQERATVKPGPSDHRVSRPRTRRVVEITKPTPLAPIGVTTIDTHYLYPPNLNLTENENCPNPNHAETAFLPLSQNGDLSQVKDDLNRRITVTLEHSMMTDVCPKDSKETQTSKAANFQEPSWLQPPPPLPYPYNFINTVKRKLQHAINSPRSCVDVAVQNSQQLNSTPEPPKSREEIKELLKSASEVKSFASHRCPNLDLEAVEHLGLVPHQTVEKVSKNLFADYDSESDTSKNIPEISSESAASSDKLSLDKLKNLKLQSHQITTPLSSVRTETNGYAEYSSDFLKESDAKSSRIKSGDGEGARISSTSSISTKNDCVFVKSDTASVATEKASTTIDNSGTLKGSSVISTEEVRTWQDSTFKSLLTEGQISKSTIDSSKTSSLGLVKQDEDLALKEPTVSLNYRTADLAKGRMKNITIRPTISTNNNVNKIHLKFEAEVRLLDDFNESLRQLIDVEKAFENLKKKNEPPNTVVPKVLQNVDTQTSMVAKNLSTTPENTQNKLHSSINYSRGSDVVEELNDSILSSANINTSNHNVTRSFHNSTFSTEMNFSNLNVSNNSTISMDNEDNFKFSTSNIENYNNNVKNCAGLSLNMFEQLIRDEDARIQQLKAIIKIREQALLDRTKGELVWLEIQKKHLIETGKVEEASLLKKKQRGIILKHEQERNEIKKLKQMQKEASEERKNILKQQRNLIKSQLSTKKMLSKIKVKTPKERRSSFGPLRVVQSCSESVHSETSISVKSSLMEDDFSITSHSVKVSEVESEVDVTKEKVSEVANVKRTLYMREAALQQRRKAAEELLRWHRKLLDEERKIAELEAAATSVIKRMPKLDQQPPPPPPPPLPPPPPPSQPQKYKFNGKQLNQLWRNMTGRDDRKFLEEKVYDMSQATLERLCKNARESGSSRKTEGGGSYSSVFDSESVQEAISNSQEEKSKMSSSISELIDNFSRIEDEISLISRKSEQDITSLKEESRSSSSHYSVQGSSIVKTIQNQTEEGAEEAISSSPKETVDDSVVDEIATEQSPESEETKPHSVLAVEEELTSKDLSLEKNSSETEHSDQALEDSRDAKSETIAVEEQEESNTKSSADVEQSSHHQVTTERIESPTSKDKSPEELNTSEIKSEDVETAKSTSGDSSKEALSLDEALECASKIEESLIKLNRQLTDQDEESKAEERSQEISDQIPTEVSTKKDPDTPEVSSKSESKSTTKSSELTDKTPPRKSGQIDVKKRVSEILADANAPRGDKSPRLQDLYITAYDVGSSSKPEFIEPFEDGRQMPTDIFGSEAEELWRKQLAIEQEIKQLEQQQKEQIPYVFMREIPNKPPPPYTPPSSLSSLPQSVLPLDVKQINEISDYSSKVLHKAHQNRNLDKVKFSENGFKLFSKVEVTKMCAEFVFNICKDIARDHYRQFEREMEKQPSWLMLLKKTQLAKTKPLNVMGLEKLMNNRLKELFGFKKAHVTESAIIKWGRKKRDHVDEILVIESQEEESQWTNFDVDELMVKDQVTKDIMKMLLEETASVFGKILAKKKVGVD